MDLVNKLREIQPPKDPPIYRECLQKLKEYSEGKNRPFKGSGQTTLRSVDTSRFEAVKTQAEKFLTEAEDCPRIKFHLEARRKE